jgi:nitrite reductase/ring-hydroxylating ferredoxin subunit
MPTWTRIAARSELPAAGQAKEFDVGNETLCIVAVDGSYAAMDNLCLHRGGSLGQGSIENGKVVCPWHAWRWDPVTGASVEDPKLKVAVYPIKLEGDDVLVEI